MPIKKIMNKKKVKNTESYLGGLKLMGDRIEICKERQSKNT